MDAFGIGAALRGVAEIYFRGARQSGRTTALLESLKDGDRVVCLTMSEARRLDHLASELGKRVKFVVLPTAGFARLCRYGTSEGRTVFDHTWVEQFYLEQLVQAEKTIDHWQREASGPGMAHVETRLAAREVARWRP